MLSALQIHRNRRHAEELDSCATAEDFQQMFATEMRDLFHLSLQLTGDAETAESCLIAAMRDCFSVSTVSKEWVHTWARRMVVRNAIRLVSGSEINIPCEIISVVCLQPAPYRIEVLRESVAILDAILDLPDFDRLAFVICALERYSILDAALLLKRTPREVNEAIARATNEVVSNEEGNRRGTPGKLRTDISVDGCDEGGELHCSCRKLLD